MGSKTMPAKIPTVVPTDAELEELGKGLTAKEIPAKLRCGICDLIAFNTVRLPCCSTNICENCYNTELSEDSDECILCHHSPLNKSICTPNKTMRTTIRALLKNKFENRLKRQAAEAAKSAKESEAVIPTLEDTPKFEEQSFSETKDEGAQGPEGQSPGQDVQSQAMEVMASATSQKSAASYGGDGQTAPEHTRPQAQQNHSVVSPEESREERDGRPPTAGSREKVQAGEPQQSGQWSASNSMGQNFMNGTASLNGVNGMFPMDFSSMMANGMMPMSGFPNMMGMGMMPPMMSQMFGGFDGSNMGMNVNAMNMGMGMNGQNQFGGPWMGGQDSYNNNAFGNSGYGNHGGYKMSGNYNMNDQAYANNDFQRGYGRQGFQNRRGRRGYYNGGYGRNNHNPVYQGNQQGYANQNASTQQLYPQPQHDQTANEDRASGEQLAPREVTAEEAEAQMMKELAPGGQHDFDEELGRKSSVDETSKVVLERSENADTSNSSDPKETLPTEATIENASDGHDDGEKAKIQEESDEDLRPDSAGSYAPAEYSNESVSIPNVAAESFFQKDTDWGGDEDADSAPQPIQTFISEEPRSRNFMPPPSPITSVGPTTLYPQDVRGQNRSGQPPSYPQKGIDNQPFESKGLGVEGAPTGPKALRQGLPNTGRSGWEHANVKPTASESVASEDGGRPRSMSPDDHRTEPYSRSRSRSLEPHYSDHQRSRRHHSPSEYNDSRREKRDERRDERRDDAHDEKHHRRSHRHYEEDEEGDTETRRSSHRSRRHHERESDLSDRRRHRHRSRSRSPDRDRERDRVSEKERYRYRDQDRDEDRKHRHRGSRSIENSAVPTPTTPYAPEYPREYDEPSSRKRRARDHEFEHNEERHERKRSRRGEQSPNYEDHIEDYSHSRRSSKPQTPITPTIPVPSSKSHRGSTVTNGVPQAQTPILSKPIPTGPRATMLRGKQTGRPTEQDRELPKASTTKTDKDPHTLEREARDRERLQREMQRRAFGGPKRKASGTGSQPSRRVSYKYEDEDGLDARRVEQEREAGRWG